MPRRRSSNLDSCASIVRSLATYQRALIQCKRQDDAAQLLISRLQDRPTRRRAHGSPGVQRIPARNGCGVAEALEAVRNRPEVRKAISKVGNGFRIPLDCERN